MLISGMAKTSSARARLIVLSEDVISAHGSTVRRGGEEFRSDDALPGNFDAWTRALCRDASQSVVNAGKLTK
ncbi:hypothetical protein OOZ19_15995 [Saccharopolyspora sp. NFXS83]|uniref:hypothetical protein n=1 Tax=Saccharopolyspora sp. NFXS83 TaxID=2993560 RepID=UPI00224B52CE|nr:hypothetical protein [Saccharopolyspora sp. NFXS83]MCX2731744.1 hypothetical protein [Saccharopolyspora sp. NFXS83]